MKFTATTLTPVSYRYLPENFAITDPEAVKERYQTLVTRKPADTKELMTIMEEAAELHKALEDEMSWRYVRMTIHADDESHADAYNQFYSEVYAATETARFDLERLFYDSAFRSSLDPAKYAHLEKIIANNIELYREDNIPLKVQESELANKYGAIMGGLSAEFDGKECTMAKLNAILKDPDRPKREAAWRLRFDLLSSVQDKLETLFDELKALRIQIAQNAGMDNYRDYMHRQKGRFSYTPEDLYRFHDAVEKVVVPFVSGLHARRKRVLGLDVLRPWDTAVDLDGRVLHPFQTTEEFIDKTLQVLDKVDPAYAEQLAMMNNTGLLDLENRKGKAPGGYNTGIRKLASSFIFMNHVNLHNDVVTLLHEAGHAMHSAALRDIALDYYCDTPSEVAELASMSMELLSIDYWDTFYPDAADLKKAKRDQLEGTLSFLPWCMIVDAFQHWLYLHPDHTPGERGTAYAEIYRRFYPSIDWSGSEDKLHSGWMMQLHIFEVPFYYIEYGMAQLGALSVYYNYRQNRDQALRRYQDFLNLGYTKPVDELYRTAGINFDFSEDRIRELVDFVRSELEALDSM